MENKFNTEVKRINGYLKEVITFLDSSGQPVSHIVNPLMVEVKPRDVLQLFVGSCLIAIKRVIIIGFSALFGAVITDYLK
jgi:hypothetical protein